MRQLSIALIALSIFTTGYVHADAQNFQGLRVGGNLNMTGASTKVTNSSSTDGSFGANNVGGGLSLAYTQRISKKTVIGIGGTFSNSKFKAGTDSANTIIKGKNIWTAYVEPGVVVGEDTLIYAKAGYAGMKGTIDEFATEHSFSGYMYGLGIRTMVDANVYMEVEALQYVFNSKTINSAIYDIKATQANVGLGYKF
jgi:opacity protein-like surface antigen